MQLRVVGITVDVVVVGGVVGVLLWSQGCEAVAQGRGRVYQL